MKCPPLVVITCRDEIKAKNYEQEVIEKIYQVAHKENVFFINNWLWTSENPTIEMEKTDKEQLLLLYRRMKDLTLSLSGTQIY